MTKTNESELLEMKDVAKQAIENAYAPYSGLKVGAALLTEGGQIFVGTNIENSSYSLSICAERVALFNALAAGHRRLSKLVVVTNSDELVYPCGACLQVLSEFDPDLEISLIGSSDNVVKCNLSDLIPHLFNLEKKTK